jgi:flagellar motor switch protein FliG
LDFQEADEREMDGIEAVAELANYHKKNTKATGDMIVHLLFIVII